MFAANDALTLTMDPYWSDKVLWYGSVVNILLHLGGVRFAAAVILLAIPWVLDRLGVGFFRRFTGWVTLGLLVLCFLPLPIVLVVVTVWTYLNVPGATVRRVLLVLGLRLAALVLALLALLRPSLAYQN